MLARSYSAGLAGVEGFLITVEADVGRGLPGTVVVGQASGPVGETRQRVKAALGHLPHDIKPRKQVVNLAPADRRKDSPGLDLAVAVALLAAHEVVPIEAAGSTMLWGELGLDGTLRSAAGTLVVADCARRMGFQTIAVPTASAAEAALIPGLKVLPVQDLEQLVAHLRSEVPIEVFDGEPGFEDGLDDGPDMSDIAGQSAARLAVEVMAAGGHNVLLHGPPGVGKTMLARRAIRLLPDLDRESALEVTKVHSVAQRQTAHGLRRRPPFRMPHHTVSAAGLLGGGNPPRPGEVSLAHRGLLFLDELLEFPRACLDGMREPLEDGEVSIVRARYAIRYPARFQLMAAANPCPCGYLGHPDRGCVCSLQAVQRYQNKLSGPLLDRIDLIVPMTPVEVRSVAPRESTDQIRQRVQGARRRQQRRLTDTRWKSNAEIPAQGGAIDRLCRLEPAADRLLDKLSSQRKLSPRAQHRIRRVARTIGDLRRPDTNIDTITKADLAAAASLRRRADLTEA